MCAHTTGSRLAAGDFFSSSFMRVAPCESLGIHRGINFSCGVGRHSICCGERAIRNGSPAGNCTSGTSG